MWPELRERLEGRLIVLEPIAREHEAAMREAAADPIVWRWMQIDASTEEGFAKWFQHALRNAEAGVEADPLHLGEAQVGIELRALLRVRDPEPVSRSERPLQPREAPLQLGAAGREVDDDVGARLRAQLRRQRRCGVVPFRQR